MEKLRIIHVLYSGLGGHGNVVFPLLESQFGEKHENVLVFFGIEEALPSYIDQAKKLGIQSYNILKKPRRYRKAFSAFKKILTHHNPDRIIVHSSELIVSAVKYRQAHRTCKVYYVEHENNKSKGLSLKLLSKYALRKANKVVCLSENYEKELKEQFNCLVPTVVIPNGINTSKFSPSTPTGNGMVIFGMASRMIPGKDHITLLNAFKQALKVHPTIQLHIAGDGETFESVKTLSKDLDLTESVQFLGLLNEEEMQRFYKSLSVYLLATKSETLSTAILQAMSCELPVITSDIKNNALLIEHNKTGWLYKDQNSVDLEQKINYAVEHMDQANQIGKAARTHVIDNYSNGSMYDKYSELIQ